MLAASLTAGVALAQEKQQPAPAGDDSEPIDNPKPPSPTETAAETQERAWQMLTDRLQDVKNFDARTQALNALSTLGSNSRANGLIADAMKDPNVDIRTAAVLAAGKTKSRALVEPMKKLLDDREPRVMFAAATTLWKQFNDRSGEDILEAVATGGRKANPTLVNGARQDLTRTLHSPSELTKIGVETGAGLVLGPFGFAVSAIEYARKNGGDSARVQSIDLLAQVRTEDIRDDMASDLGDKDPAVRAAAVKVLGSFHNREDLRTIAGVMQDSKLPVRLAAAAAYIDCGSGGNVKKKAAPHS